MTWRLCAAGEAKAKAKSDGGKKGGKDKKGAKNQKGTKDNKGGKDAKGRRGAEEAPAKKKEVKVEYVYGECHSAASSAHTRALAHAPTRRYTKLRGTGSRVA